ncbi:MAG: hypothetical protein ACOC04_04290, partial [Halothece sp.]
MSPYDLEQAVIWGRVFEISVQRGILAYLLHDHLLDEKHPQLENWRDFRVSQLNKSLIRALKEKTTLPVQDPHLEQWIQDYLRHLLVLGYGLGWSTIRECLKQKPSRRMQLEAFWCPLTLPGIADPREEEKQKTALDFNQAFQLSGMIDQGLVEQGRPARADFLLWLSSSQETKRTPEDLILCFEFSFNAPSELADFTLESSHCQEINRYARYLDARGSFSRICAEVKGDRFLFSSTLRKHLSAFSGQDKPLYKLCQASSYTEQLVKLLQQKGRLNAPCTARAMAITSNGLESLSARFTAESDPRVELMRSLGKAYREMTNKPGSY